MESPVVLDKPPEYHGIDDRGFPFEEEEGSGSGAWSELAARHPDIAARLRQHPATWARKRRVSGHDADDFGDSFGGFDRFPFDDIPPEFREHFPSHWNRRFGSREHVPQPQSPQASQASQSPPQQTTATQTEHDSPPEAPQQTSLPQYGLRNTVDLGQKSAVDPSVVDADERNQRSLSAPPESRPAPVSRSKMSQPQQEPAPHDQPQTHSKVRTIPIFVEGRDEPVINETVDPPPHFADPKPTYTPPPHQHPPPPETYDDGPMYHQPRNFTRAFGTPFTKTYQQGQPFAQKVYPQSAASRQRSQSPKTHPQEGIKIPVKHEKPQQARPEPPRPQPKPQQQQPKPQPQQQQPPPPPPPQPPKEPTPPPQPPKQQSQPPDPITQILAVQTDVLNLMTEVEKFTGNKKDKRYLYLDEMLTRNLLKLDTIETEGKENIRNARKEAIRCIQKCIAVLEAKADGRMSTSQPAQDVEMGAGEQTAETGEDKAVENGEVEMREPSKDEEKAGQTEQQEQTPDAANAQPAPVGDGKEAPQAADTRPENTEPKKDSTDKQKAKNVKKRDKSKEKSPKDKKDETETLEAMQDDSKGDSQTQMDVDCAASQ